MNINIIFRNHSVKKAIVRKIQQIKYTLFIFLFFSDLAEGDRDQVEALGPLGSG